MHRFACLVLTVLSCSELGRGGSFSRTIVEGECKVQETQGRLTEIFAPNQALHLSL